MDNYTDEQDTAQEKDMVEEKASELRRELDRSRRNSEKITAEREMLSERMLKLGKILEAEARLIQGLSSALNYLENGDETMKKEIYDRPIRDSPRA